MAKSIMIMAGGTGGHVFPALAVAKELQQDGFDVVWLGTHKGLEAEVIPKNNIPIEWITIGGLRGKGIMTLLSAPFKLTVACWQARRAMAKWRPVLVLGMGGFVTGPGGFVAWLRRVPLLIHEQNAIAGLTNRLLSRFAVRVLQAFPNTFPGRKIIDTGNPVRREIAAITEPKQRFAGRSGPTRLLVLGGSLGARALNETLPQALPMFADGGRPEVWHQTGKKMLDETNRAYQTAGVQAKVVPFIHDMAEALAWADLVVCRAGALTLSELTAAGVGAILVPFPYAVDDHQTANAKHLAQAGAAVIFQQRDMTAKGLFEKLRELMQSRRQLLAMASAARSLAAPQATQTVVRYCKEFARA